MCVRARERRGARATEPSAWSRRAPLRGGPSTPACALCGSEPRAWQPTRKIAGTLPILLILAPKKTISTELSQTERKRILRQSSERKRSRREMRAGKLPCTVCRWECLLAQGMARFPTEYLKCFSNGNPSADCRIGPCRRRGVSGPISPPCNDRVRSDPPIVRQLACLRQL